MHTVNLYGQGWRICTAGYAECHGVGTSITAFKNDINALMAELDDTYQLTEIDLSEFTPLP